MTNEMNASIEEPVDKLEDELGLLKELLGQEPISDIPELKVEFPKSVETSEAEGEEEEDELAGIPYSEMTEEQQRKYKRRKQSMRRAMLKARAGAGSVKFDASSTRDALADAALLLLATGGPGADAISSYLEKVFHDQVGAPITIKTWARSGKLKPKLMHIARNSH